MLCVLKQVQVYPSFELSADRVFDYALICMYVCLFGFIYTLFFLRQTSFMGHFKQLILDYMDIVISGSISSVSLLHRRFFMFPPSYTSVWASLWLLLLTAAFCGAEQLQTPMVHLFVLLGVYPASHSLCYG